MVLSSLDAPSEMNDLSRPAVGLSLKRFLESARDDGRLAWGIYACAKQLESHADSISLCLLADDCSGDAAAHLLFVLLEAFCMDFSIPVVKVDSAAKIRKILSANGNDVGKSKESFCCVLVEMPDSKLRGQTDESLMSYCRAASFEYPAPVIELPS